VQIRAVGLGAVAIAAPRPGRLPFSAIDRYATRYGIRGAAFDLFLRLIDILDDEYLEITRELLARAAPEG
jgi:hypothetical protein